MLVNKQIKGLYGGVSKQPPELAFDIQVDEMINCSVSPVNGIESIPDDEFTISLPDTLKEENVIHYIDKNNNEKWLVNIEPSQQKIHFYNLEGNLPNTTINNPYLTGKKEDFNLLSLGDYLFITNKNIIPKLTNSKTDNYKTQPIVYKVLKTSPVVSYIDNDEYHYKNITYNITLEIDTAFNNDSGTIIVNYVTNEVEIKDIYNRFFTQLSGRARINHNNKTYDIVVFNNIDDTSDTIHIHKVQVTVDGNVYDLYPDSEYFTIKANDDMGGTSAILIRDTIDDYGKLPADVGFEKIVKVTGLDDSDYSNFYLKCNRNGWEECLGSEVEYEIDQSTMPLVLYRDSDGVWKQKNNYWDNRKVGDEDTTPKPSFIDKNINDIFFFENRLGFITDNNVILSEQGIYNNFWNTTQRQLPETDPIDLTIADEQYLTLVYAITIPGGVLLIDKNRQYLLSRSDYQYLTPLSSVITLVGKYTIDTKVRPIFVDNKLFAIQKMDTYYNLLMGNLINKELVLENVSKQVKGYITVNDVEPTQILNFNNNIIILFKNTGIVFTYLENNNQLLINAYHKWYFNLNVLKIENSHNEKLLLFYNYYKIGEMNFKNPNKYKSIIINLKTFLLKNQDKVGNLRDIIKLKSLILDGKNYKVLLKYLNRQHSLSSTKKKIFVLNDIHKTDIVIFTNEATKKTNIKTINYEINVNNYSKSM